MGNVVDAKSETNDNAVDTKSETNDNAVDTKSETTITVPAKSSIVEPISLDPDQVVKNAMIPDSCFGALWKRFLRRFHNELKIDAWVERKSIDTGHKDLHELPKLDMLHNGGKTYVVESNQL